MVIVVPLVIAVAVTIWSLELVRYRPKRRPGVAARRLDSMGTAGRERQSRPDQSLRD
jgi:hypothetical protein